MALYCSRFGSVVRHNTGSMLHQRKILFVLWDRERRYQQVHVLIEILQAVFHDGQVIARNGGFEDFTEFFKNLS